MTGIDGPIYLDANVLIYALETDGDDGGLARRWLSQVDRGVIVAVTSELTLVEVLPHPLSIGDARLVDAYRRFLSSSPHLETSSVSLEVLPRAAELRAELGCETPDAVHVASAILAGCRGFLTNDTRLKLPSFMRRYVLSDIVALDA